MGISFDPLMGRLTVGIKGDKGDAGNPSQWSRLTLQAGEDLGGQRVVVMRPDGKAIYANAQLDHAKIVVGVTTTAAPMGTDVVIQVVGSMVDSGWSFTPGDTLFLGGNSLLSTVAPTTGFVKVMGFAVAATEIIIQMQPSIGVQ